MDDELEDYKNLMGHRDALMAENDRLKFEVQDKTSSRDNYREMVHNQQAGQANLTKERDELKAALELWTQRNASLQKECLELKALLARALGYV